MQNVVNEKRKDLDILKSNETYLLGTLAVNYDSEYPTLGETQEPVSIMKNRNYSDYSYYMDNTNILFYIKPVSEEPEYIRNIINPKCNSGELYVGIDRHHRNTDIYPFGYRDKNKYNLLTNEEKKEEIYNQLNGKLVLFTPSITYDQESGRVYKNVRIQQVLGEYNDGDIYRAIPEVNMHHIAFESKLKNGEFIYLEDYNNNMLAPEFIICNDYIYSNFKSWKRHEGNYKLWSCDKDQEVIRRAKITFNEEDYDSDVIDILDNLYFISEDFLTEYIYDLVDEGNLIFKKNETDMDYNSQLEFDYEGKVNNLIENTKEDNFEIIKTNNIKKEESKNLMDNLFKSTSTENTFLKKFKDYTIKHNLCYDMKDLINFHVSVKTNPLTILAGMSGTGKTQIAKAYGETLGINKENNTLLFLPISPSYTEPEDLIGYLNTTTGLYVASETGLVDFLVHAENNKDKIHMIIFDEMNLSQVEHWFAPFISLLELNPDERQLQLYSKGSICHNNTKYKDSVSIGDNIIFIGTVNLDETTKDFSDRLLDRANLVTLKKRKFVDFRNEKIKSYNMNDLEMQTYSYEDYKSWVDDTSGVDDLSIPELELLDDLHELIQIYDNQKGVSFRVLEKMSSYINNIPQVFDANENDIISRREAFDIEIKQRVLTKIKGSERQFGELIGRYDITSKSVANSELYNFFNSDKALKISDFTLTKQEIIRKSKELTMYGYTN